MIGRGKLEFGVAGGSKRLQRHVAAVVAGQSRPWSPGCAGECTEDDAGAVVGVLAAGTRSNTLLRWDGCTGGGGGWRRRRQLWRGLQRRCHCWRSR